MRKPEQKLWDDIEKMVGRSWSAQRHEDRYLLSIPDVSFACRGTDGWIELKVARTIPHWSRPLNFTYDHFTAGQRNWLVERGRSGSGNCFLLARVPESLVNYEHLLIRWNQLADLSKHDISWWRAHASGHWKESIDRESFLDLITTG